MKSFHYMPKKNHRKNVNKSGCILYQQITNISIVAVNNSEINLLITPLVSKDSLQVWTIKWCSWTNLQETIESIEEIINTVADKDLKILKKNP